MQLVFYGKKLAESVLKMSSASEDELTKMGENSKMLVSALSTERWAETVLEISNRLFTQ